MEPINPPDAVGHVYPVRFYDGTAVTTASGIGSLFTMQCVWTFGPEVSNAMLEVSNIMLENFQPIVERCNSSIHIVGR
jgi:hypothetical protein